MNEVRSPIIQRVLNNPADSLFMGLPGSEAKLPSIGVLLLKVRNVHSIYANCVIEVLSLHARGMVLHFASDRFQHPSQFSLFAIADADNALLLGPPGVGKTQLAVGIGMKACALGHSTVFITAAGLIGSLVQAHQENRIEEKTKLWFSRRY